MMNWETLPAHIQGQTARLSIRKPSFRLIKPNTSSCSESNFNGGPNFWKGVRSSVSFHLVDVSSCSLCSAVVVLFEHNSFLLPSQ